MKKFLLSLALLAGASAMYADEVTVFSADNFGSFAWEGGNNGYTATVTVDGKNFTITTAKAKSTSNLMKPGDQIRVYKSSDITVSSDDCVFDKVVFTATEEKYGNAQTLSAGWTGAYADLTYTATAAEPAASITMSATANQFRIAKLVVNVVDLDQTEPDGSAEHPYKIATADDLCNAYKLTKADEMVYFVQTADIDMSGVEKYTPLVGYTSHDYNRSLHYDGQNHLIKNFAPTTDEFVDMGMYCYGQSIFGVFSGELMNLGIVDMKLNAKEGRCGAISGYLGHNTAPVAVTKVSNVFATGEVNGGNANYAGGLFGTTGTAVEITNCFVNVKVTAETGSLAGGFAGRLNNPTTLKNVYVAGEVSGAANLLSGTDKGGVDATDVILFNTGSTTVSANEIEGIDVATDADRDLFIADVKGWEAFSDTKTVYGLPGLASFNYSVTATETVSSVKETIALAPKTPVVINYALTVGFVSNSNIFACDAAGDFIQLYGSNSLKVGDVIPAGWNATYELYNNVTPELTGFTLPAATEGTFTPAEVAADEISVDLVNSVVLVKNVTFEEATPATKDNFTGEADGVVLSFRNNYTLASVEAGVYDVTIVVTIYNGEPSLYVVNYAPVGGAGISDIEADAAPAVYYNLQGVRVANPDNGLYIVRRGNTVTKELIRK